MIRTIMLSIGKTPGVHQVVKQYGPPRNGGKARGLGAVLRKPEGRAMEDAKPEPLPGMPDRPAGRD